MGGGSYSQERRSTTTDSLRSKSDAEIFSSHFHASMNPKGVFLRESRDSEEHPNSVPIIIALDVTGSMTHIPSDLVRRGLPHIMGKIIESGVADPQVMFMAIGDHITDNAPLQISQFESSDETLDMWLTRVWLEKGGGGNRGESYSLAHFFANNYIQTDAWDKRKQKGFLFTIGDERFHEIVAGSALKEIMGIDEVSTFNSLDEIKKAQEKWNVYHIIPGNDKDNSLNQWKDALNENTIFVRDYKDVPEVITNIITSITNSQKSEETMKGTPSTTAPGETTPAPDTTGTESASAGKKPSYL